jgi:hypothetical protein
VEGEEIHLMQLMSVKDLDLFFPMGLEPTRKKVSKYPAVLSVALTLLGAVWACEGAGSQGQLVAELF